MQTAVNLTQQELGDLHQLIDRALLNVQQIDQALDAHPYGDTVVPVVEGLRHRLQDMRRQLLSGAKVAILDRFDQVQQMIDLLPAPLHDAHVQAYRDHLANR